MNKKRHILFGITPGPPLKPDGHLSDDWLLLAIDGELSVSDYALVKEHVRACWTCRARKEHLERTIEEIVEYEQALVTPDMPPSAGGNAIFMARLDQLATESGRPSLLRRWAITLFRTSRLGLSPSVTWIAATALAVAVCFYLVLQSNTTAISATELLQRAEASESRSFVGVNQPVVVQKLSIKVNGHKIARTIYRDTVRKRQAHRADVSASDESAIEQDFRRSSFNWDDPLSPQAYSHWREKIAEKKDAVTKLGDGLLKLDTSSTSGPVAEASLTVRQDDFHPVAEDLRLRDNTQIEVAELSYDVVGPSTLSPDIFGEPASTEPLRLPGVSANPIRKELPDAAELAISELQAQAALHRIGADLGEQITVRQGADGLVQVDGVAEDESRKRQIAAALTGIPFTELRVKTIAQTAIHQQPSHALPTPNPSSLATVVAANPPLLEEQLKQRFPDTDQRIEYVNQSLALCQNASARAWALNRLADHYTPKQVALLDRGAQQQLQRLLTDHISALREDVSRLQNQLGQVLSSASNTAAANTAVGAYEKSSPTGAPSPSVPEDWRSRVHRVHSSVETTNEAVSVLLAGSSEEDGSSDKLQLRLRTTLTQLQAELQSLGQQVRKQL